MIRNESFTEPQQIKSHDTSDAGFDIYWLNEMYDGRMMRQVHLRVHHVSGIDRMLRVIDVNVSRSDVLSLALAIARLSLVIIFKFWRFK